MQFTVSNFNLQQFKQQLERYIKAEKTSIEYKADRKATIITIPDDLLTDEQVEVLNRLS